MPAAGGGRDADASLSPLAAASGEPAVHSGTRSQEGWTIVITPWQGWWHIPFQEIWQYRDLLSMLVQRDIVTVYKQTILGPLWYIVQPLLTMLMFMLVFGTIANISTDGLPQALFYLAGIVIWNYFSETFTRTSTTFTLNAEIFGKVYFPRLLIPLSLVVSGLIKFLIQLGLFLLLYLGYLVSGYPLHPSPWLLAVPLLVVLMAAMGLGFGILFSSLTSKYRDLSLVIPFGVQLLMYATPIVYPLSLPPSSIRSIIWWNPLSHLVETFRYAFFSIGEVSLAGLCYSTLASAGMLLVGILIFNRTEKNAMDHV